MQDWVTGIIVCAMIIAAIMFFYWRHREFQKMSPAEQNQVNATKQAKRELKRQTKAQAQRQRQAQVALANLSGPGPVIKRQGGITLHSRWIKTPQGEGSLVGVAATAADESQIKQRLTATRIVAYGVFALAAPKKSVHGNAYIIVEGPDVAGVGTIAADKDTNAGPAAYAFAAEINNAARAAAIEADRLPALKEAAQAALVKAKDTTLVATARNEYTQLLSELSPELRAKYFA